MMNRIIAERALLPEGWRSNVMLEWDAEGLLVCVEADSRQSAERIPGVVLPGMANLHSHAFQRAMAGLTEYRSDPVDSFWSWRTLMYRFAKKLAPSTLKAIAVQLYIEMLKGGYTSVCEFHYLHHAADGKPYGNPAEHAECLIEAAQQAGIGLTLLPAMYQYSGFGAKPPHEGQSRFINSPRWIMDLLKRLQTSHPQHAGLRYGAAPHSLRAVSEQSLGELLGELHAWDPEAPVHIHIAEQMQEVKDCLAFTGKRPVEWLLDNAEVDARWCLVHAIHMTEAETRSLANSGAVACICPTTEANLGDGFFNGISYAAAGGAWGIGSDSHVSTSVREELRLLEYTQRLLYRQRNMLTGASGSVGGHLYREAVRGGALASGRPVDGLRIGQRADMLMLDDSHPDLFGKQGDQLLDGFIFCNHACPPVRDVMVGGRWAVRHGRHARESNAAAAYAVALKQLLT